MSPVLVSCKSCSSAMRTTRPTSTLTPRAAHSSAKSIAVKATPSLPPAPHPAPGGRPRNPPPVRSSRFKRCSSRSKESIRLHEDLAGIENALGVEGAFDAAHGFDGLAAERHLQVRRFDVADALLAADAAAKLDRDGGGLGGGGARACDRFGVGAFAHEIDVDVAIAEVAEVDDEGVVLAPYRFHALNQLRHARARDDHVLVELERAELLDGRRERAPHIPQAVFVLEIGRASC